MPGWIRNLHGIWQGLGRRFAIPAAAITSDDFNGWMTNEPSLRSRRLPIGQKSDYPSPLQIANDTGVSLIPPPSPIVNADDPRRV